jgi:predicted PurR-regulated permease PerM
MIGNLVGMIINILLTVVALYYAFKDGPAFLERFKRLMPLPGHEMDQVLARLGDVIQASVFSTFAVAAMQGVAGGLLFWVLGLPSPLLWGTVMGFASLIPVAGPPVVWVPAAIYLAAIGDWGRAVALIVAGAAIVGTLDNLVRPWLIHGRVHIHNFYLFFGILGGVYLMGFTGILLGPILVSLSLTVLRIYEERRDLARQDCPAQQADTSPS